MIEGNENVIDIRSRKPLCELTSTDIFREVTEDVLEDWYYHEAEHSLNKFIGSFLPDHVKVKGADYRNDLNIISRIEYELGIVVAFFYPTATRVNPDGWLVNFHEDTDIFTTYVKETVDGDDASESYVRALNIVLYIAYQNAKKHYQFNKK